MNTSSTLPSPLTTGTLKSEQLWYLIKNGTLLLSKKAGEKIPAEELNTKVTKNYLKLMKDNRVLILLKNSTNYKNITETKDFDLTSMEIVLDYFDKDLIEIYSLEKPS